MVLQLKAFGILVSFVIATSAQTLTVYSDNACANVIGTYDCSDYYNSCFDLPNPAASYQILPGDGGSGCDLPGTHTFNTWLLSSGQDTCNEENEVGGGGDGGCSPNGCLTTGNLDVSGDTTPAGSIICMENFGKKLRAKRDFSEGPRIKGRLPGPYVNGSAA